MHRKSLLILVLLACSIMTKAQAQAGRSPLLLLISGDIWAWTAPDQPLVPLTNDGHVYFPVVSPDGNYVAYASVPDFAKSAQCSGWPPLDIRVLTIATGDNVLAGGQPPNASYCTSNAQSSEIFIDRARPAWSPDSKSLAWGESPVPAPVKTQGQSWYRLVTYNLAQHSQRVIALDLPGNQCACTGQEVDWSTAGIADSAFLDNLRPQQFTIAIYTPNGTRTIYKQFDVTFCAVGTIYSRWVQVGTKMAVYFCNRSNGFQQYLLDAFTGKVSETSGHLELYNPNTPDALSMFADEDANGDGLWHATAKGQAVADLDAIQALHDDEYALDTQAISPDGQQVAYLSGDKQHLKIYDSSGQLTPLDLHLKTYQRIDWIGWGPKAWRIRQP